MKKIIASTVSIAILVIGINSNILANEKQKVVSTSSQSKIDALNSYIREGNIKEVTLLLKQGINVNATASNGWNPLITASKNNRLEIVKLLIKNGAKINIKNKDLYTALHKAAYLNHINIVKYLLESGAEVDVKDKFESTPLLLSVDFHIQGESNNLESIKLLLDYGASPRLRDKLGETTLDLIRKSKDKKLWKLFNKYLPKKTFLCLQTYYDAYSFGYNDMKGKTNNASNFTSLIFGCQGIGRAYAPLNVSMHDYACKIGGSSAFEKHEKLSCEVFSERFNANVLKKR